MFSFLFIVNHMTFEEKNEHFSVFGEKTYSTDSYVNVAGLQSQSEGTIDSRVLFPSLEIFTTVSPGSLSNVSCNLISQINLE